MKNERLDNPNFVFKEEDVARCNSGHYVLNLLFIPLPDLLVSLFYSAPVRGGGTALILTAACFGRLLNWPHFCSYLFTFSYNGSSSFFASVRKEKHTLIFSATFSMRLERSTPKIHTCDLFFFFYPNCCPFPRVHHLRFSYQ